MSQWGCHDTLVENWWFKIWSCVKEHNVVWNYLWFSTYYCQWRKGRKKEKHDNLKGSISNIKFFILPVLTTSASDIITVVNTISVMTAIIRPCISETHTQKKTLYVSAFDGLCYCSATSKTNKQHSPPKNKNRKNQNKSFSTNVENIF